MHEAVLRMLREDPRVVRRLLAGRIPLPSDAELQVVDATVSPASSPITRAVDLALIVRAPSHPIGSVLLFEVQLSPDPEKAFSWPVYIAHYAARYRVPCALIVITFDDAVRRWVRRIESAIMGLRIHPVVIGRDAFPRVDTVELARAEPELALLALFAQIGRPETSVIPVLRAFFGALATLDDERRGYYADVALTTLRSKAPHLRELIMRPPPDYQFQDEYMRAAEERGFVRGEALLFVRLLEKRFGPIADDLRERIALADVVDVERWAERLLVAASVTDVFPDDA